MERLIRWWARALPIATGRDNAAVAGGVLARPVGIVVTLLTIAGLLPAPSATAATEPAPVSSGTLRPVALPSHYVYWNALNDSDQLAGEASSFPSHTIHPVRWDNGVTTTFTTGGPGTGGDALAIDSAGVLFGGIVTEQPRGYPARWSPSGALTTFSAAGGLLDSFNVTVRSASDNGNVLGATSNDATHNLAESFYALPPAYAPVYLPNDAGARAINDAGDIAVGSTTAPYLLVKGVRRPLRVWATTGFDLNNNGDVAGTLVPLPSSGIGQPAIELANGTVQVLPTLHPGDEVSVSALNDHDEAVGTDQDSSTGASTAVAWIDGKVSPVTSLIAGSFSTPLLQGLDVNNNGSVLAGSVADSAQTFYLLEASQGALSVAEMTRGTGPLSADVRVKLEDPSTDASGCDPKASYHFTDPQLSSVKKVGPCNYDLTFEAPGTGIYHVGLKATVSSGVVVPVSVDQYGETVDGQFTLIIDSCSQPDDDVPDVDALLDTDNGLCDVAVGDWDSDAADVAAKVLAAVESSPTLAVDPVPIDSVDPSDWPGSRGLVLKGQTGGKGLVLKSTGTGWVPIGTKDPPELGPAGKNSDITPGDAAALVRLVNLPPLPHSWDADTCDPSKINLDDRPSGIAISMHGAWYTPNGLERVPAGDQISTYVPIGTIMNACLGLDIDTGHVHGDDTKYLHVYTAGQLMPNFTFMYFAAMQGKHVVNVDGSTTLNDLIRPGEGRISIGACAQLVIPAGATLAQAFSLLPVHTPGTGEAIGYRRVTITKNGELQTTPASP
jgi:uncharacterized membrane protein